jgi:hypothetical protein
MDDLFGVTEIAKAFGDEESAYPTAEIPLDKTLGAQESGIKTVADDKTTDVVTEHAKIEA